MELVAAVVSSEVTALVKEELDMPFNSETYWVDSTITLGYIQNETKRPRMFVANRQNRMLNLASYNETGGAFQSRGTIRLRARLGQGA